MNFDKTDIFSLDIFSGIQGEELTDMQKCMSTAGRTYKKNETVFHTGDMVHELCVVISGSVNIVNTDVWGNETILSNISAGNIFAETYALSKRPLMVDVVTSERTTVLFISMNLIYDMKYNHKSWHTSLMHNLLRICASKNLTLSTRIFCTSAKTIRERVLTYLSSQAVINGSTTFCIPFNRQQMAGYLNVDRSALSKELGCMRDEGIITFHKNNFTLITDYR